MSVTPQHGPLLDYNGILDGIVKADLLPSRITRQADSVLHDLDTKLREIGVDVPIDEIASETEDIVVSFIDHDDTDETRYTNDTQNLNTLGAALVVVLREREIPITSHEVVDLINKNGDPEAIIERFGDGLRADFDGVKGNNIKFTTPDRVYQFRIESERGESAPRDDVRDALGGDTATDEDAIRAVADYISPNTVQHKHVTRAKRKIDAMNGAFTTPASTERFVERYGEVLDLHGDTVARGVEIAGMFPETGRDPSVVAATSLWMAAQEVGEPVQQSEILNAADVTGAGLRKAKSEIDLDIEQMSVNTTTNIRAGGHISVPSVIVEWTDIEGMYVEYPTELDGAEKGDRIELDVVDDLPENSEVAHKGKAIEDGVDRWCAVDHIPLESEVELDHGYPDHVRWDYDNNKSGDVVYMTVIDEV